MGKLKGMSLCEFVTLINPEQELTPYQKKLITNLENSMAADKENEYGYMEELPKEMLRYIDDCDHLFTLSGLRYGGGFLCLVATDDVLAGLRSDDGETSTCTTDFIELVNYEYAQHLWRPFLDAHMECDQLYYGTGDTPSEAMRNMIDNFHKVKA